MGRLGVIGRIGIIDKPETKVRFKDTIQKNNRFTLTKREARWFDLTVSEKGPDPSL